MIASGARPIGAQTAAIPPAAAWPRTTSTGGGTIVVYEPQVRTWENYTQLAGVSAIVVTLPGASAPVYGAVRFTALASADVTASTVSLVHPSITATHWPNASAADASALDAFIRANLPVAGAVVPLAMVLASLPPGEQPNTVPARINPPTIIVSQTPAALVVFGGRPVMTPIPGTTLTYASNTTSTVVFDRATAKYYLLVANGWIAATKPSGPWTPAVAPAAFALIPASAPWTAIRAHLKTPAPAASAVPHVYVSVQPAVLIVLAGPPQFASIPGTQLRYVANTTSDVFFSRTTTQWYVLESGRWFSAANLNGPWTFASATLPADFKQIPEASPRGRVLSAVPGTTQALYAKTAARVPHVTPVDLTNATLTVPYTGTPAFAPIPGTALQAAANSPYPVIEVSAGQYYACVGGVWFAAAAPTGPWKAATYVPAVVYTIPPNSPLYHVTFVHVYNSAGIAQTAPPAAPVPQPTATYQTFSAGNVSNGTLAGLYNADTAPYYGGNWAPFPVTQYNNSTYAAQQQQYQQQQLGTSYDPRRASTGGYLPGHGVKLPVNPDNNVFAGDDGNVYRNMQGAWQLRSASATWTEPYGIATPTLTALSADARARADGYRGRLN